MLEHYPIHTLLLLWSRYLCIKKCARRLNRYSVYNLIRILMSQLNEHRTLSTQVDLHTYLHQKTLSSLCIMTSISSNGRISWWVTYDLHLAVVVIVMKSGPKHRLGPDDTIVSERRKGTFLYYVTQLLEGGRI